MVSGASIAGSLRRRADRLQPAGDTLAEPMRAAPERPLSRSLARATAGKSLSVDEVQALLSARGDTLDELMSLASNLRELGHGRIVTYSRKVFVPLTKLCRDHCHY